MKHKEDDPDTQTRGGTKNIDLPESFSWENINKKSVKKARDKFYRQMKDSENRSDYFITDAPIKFTPIPQKNMFTKYRVREYRGKFTVEKLIEHPKTFWQLIMNKPRDLKYHVLDEIGHPIMVLKTWPKEYESIDEALQAIKNFDEEPTYHYIQDEKGGKYHYPSNLAPPQPDGYKENDLQ